MIVDAVVGNLCPAPSLNWVDVTVTFQPPPTASPRASTTWIGSEYEVVWSSPFSVRLNDGVPFPATERVAPAVTVALAVTVAARAAATASKAAKAAAAPMATVLRISLEDIIAPGREVSQRETVGKRLERLPPGAGPGDEKGS